jgi:hypothetical protein
VTSGDATGVRLGKRSRLRHARAVLDIGNGLLMRRFDSFGFRREARVAAYRGPALHGMIAMPDFVLRVPARALKFEWPHVYRVHAVKKERFCHDRLRLFNEENVVGAARG